MKGLFRSIYRVVFGIGFFRNGHAADGARAGSALRLKASQICLGCIHLSDNLRYATL